MLSFGIRERPILVEAQADRADHAACGEQRQGGERPEPFDPGRGGRAGMPLEELGACLAPARLSRADRLSQWVIDRGRPVVPALVRHGVVPGRREDVERLAVLTEDRHARCGGVGGPDGLCHEDVRHVFLRDRARERCRERLQPLQPFGLGGDVPARTLQLFTGFLAIGDVARHAHHARDRPVVVLDDASPPLDPTDRAVWANDPVLDVVPRRRLERVTDRVPHGRTILRMQDALVRLVRAVERSRSEAVHGFEALVPGDAAARQVPFPCAELCGRRGEARLAVLPFRRRSVVRFVLQIPDHAGHGPSVLRIAVLNSSTVSARGRDTAGLCNGGRRTATGRSLAHEARLALQGARCHEAGEHGPARRELGPR